MTQNTEQNVRTRDEQVAALFDAIDTFPSNRSSDDRMGYKRQASAQTLAEAHILEAEARGAEEQRRKDAEGCEIVRQYLTSRNQWEDCSQDHIWAMAIESDATRRTLYTHPAKVPALEARIAELVEAERHERTDAEANKARVRVLEEALRNVCSAIEQADPKVLCCTLWMTTPVPETVVDYIGAALAREGGV